jgi:hypothetical protein
MRCDPAIGLTRWAASGTPIPRRSRTANGLTGRGVPGRRAPPRHLRPANLDPPAHGRATDFAVRPSYDYATVAYDASSGVQLWVSPYNGPANGDDGAL